MVVVVVVCSLPSCLPNNNTIARHERAHTDGHAPVEKNRDVAAPRAPCYPECVVEINNARCNLLDIRLTVGLHDTRSNV